MKRVIQALALLALASFALGHLFGCTHLYRTGEQTASPCLSDPEGLLLAGSVEACATAQGEYAAEEGKYSYTLYFVEFDDQGWPYRDGAYMERVLQELKAKLQGPGRARHGCVNAGTKTVHLILYVHGWKHTADAADANVRNFRKLVRESASAECRNGTSGREVVGIYVGWRGRPVETPEAVSFLDNLTFWDRKAAAIDVAQGSLREFFARIDAMVDRANDAGAPQKPVRMLMVGHSFGGHILLTALGGSVLANLAAVVDDDPYDPVQCQKLSPRRDGDLIVLVNPAIEGTRFEPLFSVGTKWKLPCYKAPILISVTSTGDWATGTFFPIGRWFSTWFESYTSADQKSMDRKALGHSDYLITHELGLKGDGPPFEGRPAPEGDCERVWSTDTPNVEEAVAAEYRNERRFLARQDAGQEVAELPRVFCAGAILVPRAGTEGRLFAWRAPLMNIRVRPSLVANHNDIYNPRFVSFLRELYMDTLTKSVMAK
jgi:hypothetical protein